MEDTSKPPPYLPEDIVYQIILRLPLKSIARFKLASKQWNTLLSNPHFINDHRRLLFGGDHLLFCSYKYNEIYTIECANTLVAHLETQELSTAPMGTTPHELPQFLQSPSHNNRRLFYNLKLSSCNGLVLLTNRDYLDFVIWNPLTREYMLVDATSWKNFRENYYCCSVKCAFRGNKYYPYDYSLVLNDKYSYISCNINLFALCYNASRDEYTILLVLTCSYIVAFPDNYEHIRVLLLNCKTGELKCQDYRGFRNMRPTAFSTTVVVCGAPHWLTDLYTPRYPSATTRNEIVYFDLKEERLRRRVMPDHVGKERTELLGLGALNGQNQLGIVVNNVIESWYEVWVMKEYGMSDSWTKMFVIPPNNVTKDLESLDVLGYMPTGELLMDVNKQGFVVYDPRNDCVRSIKLWTNWCEREDFFVTAHEPSLVAPPRADPSKSTMSKNYGPWMIGLNSVFSNLWS